MTTTCLLLYYPLKPCRVRTLTALNNQGLGLQLGLGEGNQAETNDEEDDDYYPWYERR